MLLQVFLRKNQLNMDSMNTNFFFQRNRICSLVCLIYLILTSLACAENLDFIFDSSNIKRITNQRFISVIDAIKCC